MIVIYKMIHGRTDDASMRYTYVRTYIHRSVCTYILHTLSTFTAIDLSRASLSEPCATHSNQTCHMDIFAAGPDIGSYLRDPQIFSGLALTLRLSWLSYIHTSSASQVVVSLVLVFHRNPWTLKEAEEQNAVYCGVSSSIWNTKSQQIACLCV